MTDKERVELERLRQWRNGLPFCPDHRDKVKGKPCRECEIERLKLIAKAAYHLLMAANGPDPDDGPTSWTETRTQLLIRMAHAGIEMS